MSKYFCFLFVWRGEPNFYVTINKNRNRISIPRALYFNGKLLWWLGSWFWFYLYFSWLTRFATVSSILPIKVLLFSNERLDSEFLEEFSKIEFCFSTSDSLFCSLIYSSLQFKIQMEFQICFLRNFDYLLAFHYNPNCNMDIHTLIVTNAVATSKHHPLKSMKFKFKWFGMFKIL